MQRIHLHRTRRQQHPHLVHRHSQTRQRCGKCPRMSALAIGTRVLLKIFRLIILSGVLSLTVLFVLIISYSMRIPMMQSYT